MIDIMTFVLVLGALTFIGAISMNQELAGFIARSVNAMTKKDNPFIASARAPPEEYNIIKIGTEHFRVKELKCLGADGTKRIKWKALLENTYTKEDLDFTFYEDQKRDEKPIAAITRERQEITIAQDDEIDELRKENSKLTITNITLENKNRMLRSEYEENVKKEMQFLAQVKRDSGASGGFTGGFGGGLGWGYPESFSNWDVGGGAPYVGSRYDRDKARMASRERDGVEGL